MSFNEPFIQEFTSQSSINDLITIDLQNDINSNLEKVIHNEKLNNLQVSSRINNLIPKILSRGPNYACFERKIIEENKLIESFTSVLSLREPFTKQPIGSGRFCLQFNGELYNDDIRGNDTEYFMEKLLSNKNLEDDDGLIFKTVGDLKGEFSFIIHDLLRKNIYFGKDISGRRSLLYLVDENQTCISSISDFNSDWIDCEGGNVYKLQISTNKVEKLNKYTQEYNVTDIIKSTDTDFVGNFEILFTKAINDRLLTIRPLNSNHVPPKNLKHLNDTDYKISYTNSEIGILFSGGIDCCLIANICGELLTKSKSSTIDLLNVSFENRRTNTPFSETPDRKLGKSSYKYLERQFPQVIFNFIEVDISYEEYLLGKNRVKKLMYPHSTEMDLSIAIAFFFASRGWGKIKGVETFSNCPVLFSGLGADELFGGYSRHDRIFLKKGKLKNHKNNEDLAKDYEYLKNELNHDINNIWIRNISRDDKVMSCWGKELRYPFLDEVLVNYVCSEIPLSLKVNIDNNQIVKKKLLRDLAKKREMFYVMNELKRAIQFGTKSAKMEPGQGRIKGTDKFS